MSPEPTIQIVDDDESFLAAISRLLRASGFAVTTFSSASELLAACDADAPGCVLADLQMPRNEWTESASRACTDSKPAAHPLPHGPRRHSVERACHA